METLYERIGDSAPDAALVATHVVFLAADVDDGTAGTGSIQTEVGTPLFVDLGEVVARDGGLGDEGIGRNVEGLLHLIAHQFEHLLTVACTELTVARGVEVQSVRTVGASCRRDDVSCVDGLGQFLNLFHTSDADTLTVSLHDLTDEQRRFLRLQLQVTEHVVVNLLHHSCPFRVASVRLTLMHQHTLDDAILLSLLGQCDEALVGIVVVGCKHGLHPAWGSLYVVLDAVGQESLNGNAADSHVDHTDADVLGQRLDHSTTKPVCRRQACIRAAERGRGFTPLTHLAASLRVVDSRHEQKARTRTGDVLSLGLGCSLHVRLSETEEDIEIRVYFCHCFRKWQERQCRQQHVF